MRKIIFIILLALGSFSGKSQNPCSSPNYRQFDFWIGEWDVFGPKGNKAGDSKISLILDSCVILEEWTSAGMVQNVRFAGKSFNTYNAATGQWQQIWVDNTGGSTNFAEGKFSDKKLVFTTAPFPLVKDTMAIRRLTFFHMSEKEVRQLGEISKDNGVTWQVEYDLAYRRRK